MRSGRISFQAVILQHVHLVTGVKNIFAQINTRIDFWNSGAFGERLHNSYGYSTQSVLNACIKLDTQKEHWKLSVI